jgi:CheY-like chemotaxis protein
MAKRSVRILHAEDDAEVSKALARLFTDKGHKVERVPDGQHALNRLLLRPADFDVLLTDHEMRPVGGLALVQQLRAANCHIPVVVFSAQLGVKDHHAYRALGVDGIYTKPMDGRMLPDIIEKLIFGPRENPA